MPKRIDLTPQFKSGRPELLAFNLWDLELVHPHLRAKLLPLLDLRRANVVWVDKDREDETAAPFTCLLLTSAIACDMIREIARKVNETPPRIYLNRTGAGSPARRDGAWVRLPGDAILTHLVNGKPVLDPTIFPGEVIPFKPLEARRVRF